MYLSKIRGVVRLPISYLISYNTVTSRVGSMAIDSFEKQ